MSTKLASAPPLAPYETLTDIQQPPFLLAIACALLVVLGSIALLPVWIHIARVWASDPLRFIGATFPLISLVGVLAAWQRLGWRLDGRLLGLMPIALSILLGRIVGIPTLAAIGEEHYSWLIHPGVVLFLFAAGSVLLFGGPRLLRVALAPLCLLLFVNPVPSAFNARFDLPLQQLSASTARAFAHLIGLRPTGEQLRMMFTPSFGMMIVPGCNGVRGSVTFAYLTLIFGYSQRLRADKLAAITVSALLLGYLMNLLRLCTLVIYYRAGLSFVSIQDYGAQVDYVIGCTIFLFSTLLLGYVIRSIAPTTPPPPPERSYAGTIGPRQRTALLARAAAFAILALVFIVPQRHLFATALPLTVDEQQVLRSLPARVGPYRLVHTDDERYPDGRVAMVVADYAAPATSTVPESRITLGLYVAGSEHVVRDSKKISGQFPVWSGAFDASAVAGIPVHFGGSLYYDGSAREYDAEATCSETGCINPLLRLQPDSSEIAFSRAGRSLPILLRRSWPASDQTPVPQLRAQFEADVRQFTQRMDIPSLVRLAGFPL
jgi:exosortase J